MLTLANILCHYLIPAYNGIEYGFGIFTIAISILFFIFTKE